ncbi:pectin lyase fold/virulence factor [Vibrio phage 1.178.O._10N.286.45.E12]|nr:pectin lyase fold/virulence factor [Vibrio phage 1.178.O._10N.286.45.E12]
MSCEDYPTAQTAKTFKLDAETVNEVVTLEQDRTSEAGDGKTKKTLWGIENDATNQRDEFEQLASDQRDNFEVSFGSQFNFKRIGNISDYAGQSLPETEKLNSYQYPDDSGDWYVPEQGQSFPITIPADPTAAGSDWYLQSPSGVYRGLWPDTGGSADKGDTYQTQVGGTPTGQYFTALQNTTADPVGDDVNWRVVISIDSLSQYTDIVYKASGGKSAIENMIEDFALNPLMRNIGTVIKTGGTTWVYEDSTGPITHLNFRAFDAVNVMDCGAKGDGTPCADAFIYATTLRCNTIYVPDGGIFQIEKEVDLKFKNLVGGGGISQSTTANGISEISHPVGYTGVMFSYPGGTIRDIYFRGNGATATCFNRIGYNQRFQDCTFRVFSRALHSIGGTAGATVNFYVDRCNFYSNSRCFWSEDVNSNDSTTTHISNCEFNNNDECIIFDKNAYGCSFTNLIFEYCNVALSAKAFASCHFDTLWYEYTLDGTDRDIVITNNQLFQRNKVDNIYIHPSSTWNNNISSDGTSAGGVFADRDTLRVGGFQGDRVKIQDRYFQDDFNSAFGGTTNRQFGIKGSDQHPISGLSTTVRVDHGTGGRVVFGHTDESRTTETIHRRATGPNSAGDGAYLALDKWDANEERSWEAYDPDATGDVGKFRALQYLVYNGSTVNAGGYILAKTSTGAFSLTRENGGIPSFSNPALSISGIEVSSGFLVHKVIIGGTTIQIFFADLSGTLTDPDRFTLGFQNT